MVGPALHAGGDLVQRHLAPAVRQQQSAQLTLIVYPLSPLQATFLWEKREAQKGKAFAHRAGVGAGMDGQPQAGQALLDRLLPGPQRGLVAGEQQQVFLGL